jgi:hypothetical protein
MWRVRLALDEPHLPWRGCSDSTVLTAVLASRAHLVKVCGMASLRLYSAEL